MSDQGREASDPTHDRARRCPTCAKRREEKRRAEQHDVARRGGPALAPPPPLSYLDEEREEDLGVDARVVLVPEREHGRGDGLAAPHLVVVDEEERDEHVARAEPRDRHAQRPRVRAEHLVGAWGVEAQKIVYNT